MATSDRRPAAGASPRTPEPTGGAGYRSRFADPGIDRLFAAILELRSPGECYRFFEDLCTVGELRALAQRLHVAALLTAGATYDEIQVATGMSSATISRIKRFLLYGADGYRLVLDRMARSPAGGEDGLDPPREAVAPNSRPDRPGPVSAPVDVRPDGR